MVIDLVTRFVPAPGCEIDVNEVKAFILEIIGRGFKIKIFSYDTWQAAHISQELEKRGVTVKNKCIQKTEHDFLKDSIYSGDVIIPKNEVLASELKSLILIRGDRVDHPPSNTKDLADAVAGVCHGLLTEKRVCRRPIIPVIL